MDKYLKQLESWVMDEGKIVTIEYMLQSTSLNAVQIQSLFKKLLEIHVELNATYYLIGQDTTNQRKKCLIVKKEDLGRTKQQFDKVTLCNINSVHMAPVKCLEILYNADWNGKREMTMNDLEGKAFIMSTTAEKCYEEMKKFNGENKPPKNETRSPAKYQNQGISPKKSEPPPKIHKGEKPAGAAPKKAVKPKPGTQMKISNFFTQK